MNSKFVIPKLSTVLSINELYGDLVPMSKLRLFKQFIQFGNERVVVLDDIQHLRQYSDSIVGFFKAYNIEIDSELLFSKLQSLNIYKHKEEA